METFCDVSNVSGEENIMSETEVVPTVSSSEVKIYSAFHGKKPLSRQERISLMNKHPYWCEDHEHSYRHMYNKKELDYSVFLVENDSGVFALTENEFNEVMTPMYKFDSVIMEYVSW